MRNNLFILSLVTFFLISCINKKTAQYITPKLMGEYYKEFEDHLIYSLILKEDHTFIYSIKGGAVFNGESKCIGKWQVIQNELILNCDEESLLSQLSSGYMASRKFKVKFINNKTLRLNEIYLNKR